MKKISTKTAVPTISINGAAIRLNERIVFSNLHWNIFESQFWAVIGPNGSGKSVLVRALCGELPVVNGEIVYQFPEKSGFSFCDDPIEAIGYVNFDMKREIRTDDTLFVQARYWSGNESLTVRDFLSRERVLEINPFQVVESRETPGSYTKLYKRVCVLLNIGDLLDKEISMLSNGESGKLLIARAILKKPRLLILDNPFQGFDSVYREYLGSVIIPSLQRMGIQVMLVITDPDDLPDSVTHIHLVRKFTSAVMERDSFDNYHEKHGSKPFTVQFTEKSTPAPRRKGIQRKAVPLVQMSSVSISYGRKKVLSDINWTVNDGEHWAVLGANGSGKTTLLSLILGDHPQIYANDITVFGIRWGKGSTVSDIKKKIGWVSPELQVCYPQHESCFNVVVSGFFDSIGLFRKASPQQRKTVQHYFKTFALEGIEQEYFGSQSEGIQRLLLLMRALVKNPRLLILDEPLQGLSNTIRKKFLSLFNTIPKRYATTLLYVTHQTGETPPCIRQVLQLDRGNIRFSGSR